ncbi:hypothetical protein OROGR_028523 [Orobanche gracilis]
MAAASGSVLANSSGFVKPGGVFFGNRGYEICRLARVSIRSGDRCNNISNRLVFQKGLREARDLSRSCCSDGIVPKLSTGDGSLSAQQSSSLAISVEKHSLKLRCGACYLHHCPQKPGFSPKFEDSISYADEIWSSTALNDCHVHKMSVAEMRMLRWMCGHTRKDRVSNEIIRTKVGVTCIENKMRENRLRWFGHIKRREMSAPVRRLERWQEEETMRGRGKPKETEKRVIESDMNLIGIEKNLAVDRTE